MDKIGRKARDNFTVINQHRKRVAWKSSSHEPNRLKISDNFIFIIKYKYNEKSTQQ